MVLDFQHDVYSPSVIGMSGIGDAPDTPNTNAEKAVAGAMAGGMTGVATAISTGSNLAGGIAGGLALVAPFTGPAAPFILAASALVAPIANMFKGCGNTCKEATTIANKAADALTQVSQQYWAQPIRTKASQTAALMTIEQVIGYIQQACGSAQLGAAGQRCVQERTVRGYRAPAFESWCPKNLAGCSIWELNYDPIANDTGVQPDPVAQSQVGSNSTAVGMNVLTSQTFGIPTPLLVGGAALLGVLLLFGGKD